MKKISLFFKICLSALCVAFFVFLAAASDEGKSDEGGYTPVRVEENVEKDYSSDVYEDTREEEEEYESAVEEDYQEVVEYQSVIEKDSVSSDSVQL